MPVHKYFKQTYFPGYVDWNHNDPWPAFGSNEPREIYELVGYDPPCEAGPALSMVDWEASGTEATWPEDETYRYIKLPAWLEEIIERDERAALAESETVLAPEKTLVGAT